MTKTNIELFKKALHEALEKKIEEIIATDEIEVIGSPEHNAAMQKIIRSSRVSYKMRRIIALVAILGLLLTSCAVIYRDKIGDLVMDIFERYDLLTPSGSMDKTVSIDEVYELTYLPGGYRLENSVILPYTVSYYYCNENGKNITFNQDLAGESRYQIDNENGETSIFEINGYSIYYRQSNEVSIYLWNDDKYIMLLSFDDIISIDEVRLIVEGITKK